MYHFIFKYEIVNINFTIHTNSHLFIVVKSDSKPIVCGFSHNLENEYYSFSRFSEAQNAELRSTTHFTNSNKKLRIECFDTNFSSTTTLQKKDKNYKKKHVFNSIL